MGIMAHFLKEYYCCYTNFKKNFRYPILAKVFEAVPVQLPCLIVDTYTSHTHSHFPCINNSHVNPLPLNSFLRFKHTSLILLFLTFSVPVTSRSRCPTALLTSEGRERERKETGVDRGEDEADGSRGVYK